MRIVALSDVHLMSKNPVSRKDNVRETQLKKLSYVFKWAKDNNVDCILQAGDLFDAPRSWYLLPDIIMLLNKYKSKFMLHTVYGQHDTYMYSQETKVNTSMGIIDAVGLINVLDSNPTNFLCFTTNIHVYGCHYGMEIPKVKEVGPNDLNILVIHASLAERPLYHGHNITQSERFLLDHKSYDIVITGDVHRQFLKETKDGRTIMNTGPMLRKTAEGYSFEHKPRFYVIDISSKQDYEIGEIEIPHRPADEIVSTRHIEQSKLKADVLAGLVEAINSKKKYGIKYVENLFKFIRDNDIEDDVSDFISVIIDECEVENEQT